MSYEYLTAPIVTFVISFFTSMGGISGAFILLPFQVSILGITTPSVSATNHLFNVVGIPGGIYKYFREGRFINKLVVTIILGTVPGVFVGTIIRVEYLPDPTNFKLFAGIVLLIIGIKLLLDSFKKNVLRTERKQKRKNGTKIKMGDDYYFVPLIQLSLFSFIVGIVGGIYGIGGGVIIAPVLISVLGLPVYYVAGAVLTSTFATSFFGIAFFQLLAFIYPGKSIAPDWLLGILFGVGGLAGMYLGAKFQKKVPEIYIKSIIAMCLLFISFKYIYGFFS